MDLENTATGAPTIKAGVTGGDSATTQTTAPNGTPPADADAMVRMNAEIGKVREEAGNWRVKFREAEKQLQEIANKQLAEQGEFKKLYEDTNAKTLQLEAELEIANTKLKQYNEIIESEKQQIVSGFTEAVRNDLLRLNLDVESLRRIAGELQQQKSLHAGENLKTGANVPTTMHEFLKQKYGVN